MLTIAPAATRHDPAREFIHDHRIAIANDVIHILDEQLFGLKRVGDVVRPRILGIKRS